MELSPSAGATPTHLTSRPGKVALGYVISHLWAEYCAACGRAKKGGTQMPKAGVWCESVVVSPTLVDVAVVVGARVAHL